MTLWARGALTLGIGAGLFVLCGVTALFGGSWLIPVFGRDVSQVGIVVGTIASIGLMILGLVALARGLMRRDQPTSNCATTGRTPPS